MKNAAVHQAEAMRVYDEDESLGVAKGKIAPHNPVEEALLVKHRPVSGVLGVRHTSSARSSHRVRSCSSATTASFGSSHTGAQSELRRIHEMMDEAREVGRKGAAAHQLEAIRQVGEDTILHDIHHPDNPMRATS
jgi:hypothetical protein